MRYTGQTVCSGLEWALGQWKGHSTNCCLQTLDDEEYGGPRPFSEPESRIVKLIAESSPVRSFVNLHSGEYALYIPWDSHPNYAIDLPVCHA